MTPPGRMFLICGDSPSLASILALGLVLLTFFICWQAAAESLYVWLFGPTAPQSFRGFLAELLTTSRGWTLIILGNAIGFVFAAVGAEYQRHLISHCSSTAI